jgi:hypothetical protein
MFLDFYNGNNTIFEFEGKKLYFICSSNLINQICNLESNNNNPYTERKQFYLYNRALLNENPVSFSNISENSYIKEQYNLFIKLSRDISFDNIKNENVNDNYKFIIKCVSNNYLKVLLNFENIDNIQEDIIELLDILEEATGKHNITFKMYLENSKNEYSDIIEIKYIELFYKIVCKVKNKDLKINLNKEQICYEIINLIDECNIMTVLSKYLSNPVIIVNNILSWIDNMLNIVHTIINMLILIGCSDDKSFNSVFYKNNITKARSLATMFMREVKEDFEIIDKDISYKFKVNDIIMMSNGNNDTLFGGKGRKCPARSWSIIFMEKIINIIYDKYLIECKEIRLDPNNNSWFWKKFDNRELKLILK